MAYTLMKSLRKSVSPCAYISSSSLLQVSYRSYAKTTSSSSQERVVVPEAEQGRLGDDDDVVPTSGISRPLSEILKELNKRVPDSLVRARMEDGFSIKYVPWHIVNRIMNLHAPEWSGEVRSITYSADGTSVSVVYRVTLYGTDAESDAVRLRATVEPHGHRVQLPLVQLRNVSIFKAPGAHVN